MTRWLGLTGGIGSGKSAAADFFLALGVPVIDADHISRGLTAKNGVALKQIREQFGELAVTNGELNRAWVRDLVFQRPEAKRQLEAILHPLIKTQIQQQQRASTADYGIVDVPLLAEIIEFQQVIERILVIDCPTALQIERVQARSGLSPQQITAIMMQQATRAQRLAIADDVIVNDGDLNHLQQQVLAHHHFYQQLFAAP